MRDFPPSHHQSRRAGGGELVSPGQTHPAHPWARRLVLAGGLIASALALPLAACAHSSPAPGAGSPTADRAPAQRPDTAEGPASPAPEGGSSPEAPPHGEGERRIPPGTESTSGEKICGGFAGATCNGQEYCAYQVGQHCGAADASSTCKPRPEACTYEYRPVCGCDNQTYGNACSAAAAGQGVLTEGECPAADKEPLGS